MRVRILAFASAAERIGRHEHLRDLPDGATVAALWQALLAEHPALQPLDGRIALAVDGTLAPAATLLSDGCEVALLPPVSGG